MPITNFLKLNKNPKMGWTHSDIKIKDIRKIRNIYVLKIDDPDIPKILINSNILDERILSYFLLKDFSRDKKIEKSDSWNKFISRKELLDLKWNMHISKGCFYKYNKESEKLIPEEKDPKKYYISFIEIAGPLGSFDTIISK